jgi:hypothetical protein
MYVNCHIRVRTSKSMFQTCGTEEIRNIGQVAGWLAIAKTSSTNINRGKSAVCERKWTGACRSHYMNRETHFMQLSFDTVFEIESDILLLLLPFAIQLWLSYSLTDGWHCTFLGTFGQCFPLLAPIHRDWPWHNSGTHDSTRQSNHNSPTSSPRG